MRPVSSTWGSSSKPHRLRPSIPVGPAAAARLAISENSAMNAEKQSQPMVGSVNAASLTKANSAANAVSPNLPARRSIAVINAVGNRKIRRIRRNSVPNAATCSIKTIKNRVYISFHAQDSGVFSPLSFRVLGQSVKSVQISVRSAKLLHENCLRDQPGSFSAQQDMLE